MPKQKISEFNSNPALNTDIDSINIAEGCAPSGINDAIRELMAQLKDFQTGAAGDSFNGPVGTTTAAAGAFTTLTASSTATLNTLASSGATLTGGSINNMTIGGTTAAAVSATTLTTSGAVTLNGGTANGVAYLNGSKVLTTGSALTFDGVGVLVSGSGGSGSSSSLLRLNGSDASSYGSYLQFQRNGVNKWTIGTDSGINGGTSDDLTIFGTASQRFYASSAEQMRLTSTGLGIGTSSPAFKLDVNGDAGITASESYLYFYSNYSIGNNSRVRMRAVGAGGGSGYGGDLRISTRASNNSWNTDAMTLDASGNLGVGTTSIGVNHRLEVAGAQKYLAVTANAGSGGTANPSSSSGLFMSWNRSNGEGESNIVYGTGAGTSPALAFGSWNGTTYTERARIDSSGNLLVGTTTSVDQRIRISYDGSSPSWGMKMHSTATSGDNKFIEFGTEGSFTARGSITYNRASGLTVYNTTSDYRAKDIYGVITDSGSVIDSVPVYMGKMKGATQERPMFIAHETPSYAHTGEKDAVDADGNPVYQQMDASALIPVMWAEIQSLRKRLADAGL